MSVLSALFGEVDNEPRDERGRWTDGGGSAIADIPTSRDLGMSGHDIAVVRSWQRLRNAGEVTSAEINHFLRTGHLMPPPDVPWEVHKIGATRIHDAVRALDDMTSRHTVDAGVLYRGVDGSTIDMSKLQVGDVIRDKGFASFTPDQKGTFTDFPIGATFTQKEGDPVIEAHIPEGTHGLAIPTDLADQPSWETIFPRNQGWVVTGIDPSVDLVGEHRPVIRVRPA